MPDKIYMLNALWFKPDGGREKYKKYLKAVLPLIDAVGGKKLRSLVPDRALIGEFDADLMFFVEFPDWQAFKNFANSSEFHKIAYLREESIDNSLLIRCNRPEKAFR